MKHPSKTVAASLLSFLVVIGSLSACGKSEESVSQEPASTAARGAIYVLEALQQTSLQTQARPSALLGIFVADFLAQGLSANVQSALKGIEAQQAFAATEQSVDPDYDLLQAFADALGVDLQDLLNRSPSRETSLNKYVDALNNVAQRAQTRSEELDSTIKGLQDTARTIRTELTSLKRESAKLVKDKKFAEAGEIQQSIIEKQQEQSEADLNVSQARSVQKTLNDLLKIYEKRSLAIEQNREALIAGIKVTDVPGAKDINVLQDLPKNGSRSSSSARNESPLMNLDTSNEALNIGRDE